MKKIATLLIALVLVMSLATVWASADAYNPNGGCEVDFQVKKADSANVIKDGVIGSNEYTELSINRDPDTTDLLLSWIGNGMFENAEQFLQNVHFYFSWDDVNGFNIGITATHLEPIVQTHTMPTNYSDFPGDEFIISAGAMFRAYQDTDSDGTLNEIYYRGVTKNTETGEYLIGYYWPESSDGLNGTAKFEAGTNLVINYGAGNTVTYEMSIPLADIVANPGVGSEIFFDLSVCGGSSEGDFNDAEAYIVSLGDEGYCTSKNAAIDPAQAKATLSAETISAGSDGDNGDNGGDTTTDNGTTNNTENDTTTVDDNGNIVPVSDNSGNKTTGSSTKTGDAAVILAVVSSLSACGVVLGKKRK